MTVRIFTPETAFLQDMADVSRLFYGDAPLFFNEEGESDVRIAHTVSRQNGCWCDQFTGGPVSVFRAQGRDGEGELMQKRLRKRAVNRRAPSVGIAHRHPPLAAVLRSPGGRA